jgi:hypothetical protein
MSETSAILIIVGLCVSTAVICHWLIRRYTIASVCSAVIADLLLQIANYIENGYRDPFIQIALITGGGIALCIALLVGIPFVARRKKRVEHMA